jgi:hypothetical protein
MPKKETPKADALAAVLAEPKSEERVPPYIRSWEEFCTNAQAGMRVRLKIRDNSKLRKAEGVITRRFTNCFYYEDDEGDEHSCPWWAVHDWEVLHAAKATETL